jgi:DNA polymerase-3 subunit epsilon
MTWHLEPMAAFDLETTGVDPETARIVTATIARIHGADVQTLHRLVDPGVPIPAEATAIHGVSTERAHAEGVDPATACARILAELDEAWTGGRPVVIYNAPYDLTVLDRELRRHCSVNLDGVIGPVIDPFVVDKHVDPYRRGSRTLTATCGHYGVALTDAHTSTGDALAAARLAWRLAQLYPAELGDLTKVNALQAAWRAEWATNFADYLRRQGRPEDIDGSWPLRPWRTDQAAPDTEGTTAA